MTVVLVVGLCFYLSAFAMSLSSWLWTAVFLLVMIDSCRSEYGSFSLSNFLFNVETEFDFFAIVKGFTV